MQEKRNLIVGVVLIIAFVVGLACSWLGIGNDNMFLLAASFGVIGVFMVVLNYIQTGFDFKEVEEASLKDFKEFKDKNSKLTLENKKLKEQLEQQKLTEVDYNYDNPQDEIDELRYSLKVEIKACRRRSNLSLVLGTTLAIVGIVVVAYNLNDYYGKEGQSWNDFFMRFLPRLSMVISVEVVAFFFLRVYLKTLADLRHWVNEQLNIDAKILAVQLAIYQDDDAVLKKVIEQLLATERNFILNKGQRTVEIATKQQDLQGLKQLAKVLVKQLKALD